MKLVALLALGVLSSLPLQSQSTEPPAPPAEKKICKTVQPTGSILGKRICLTKAQWAELNARTEASAEAALRHRGAGTCDGELGNPRCGSSAE